QDIRIVGLRLESRKELLDGRPRTALFGQRHTEQIELLRALQMRNGFGRIAQRQQGLADHAVSFHKIWPQLEGPPKLGDCACVVPLLFEQAGELEVLLKLRHGVLRLRSAHLDHKPGSDQTSLDRNSHQGSFTVRTWSAKTRSSACIPPLGQRISTRASRALPNPKCSLLSFAER